MNLAIIGYGFVGAALKSAIKEDVKVFLVDPKLNTSIADLKSFKPDIIFISVPTPMQNNGDQDLSILSNVIKEIKKIKLTVSVVIKSTVLPNNISVIKNLIPNIIYNPEFLREISASDDLISAESIIIGGNKNDTQMLEDFYRQHTLCKCKKYIHTDIITASFVKYTINTFLASKVTFFNEIHKLFVKSNPQSSWKSFVEIVSEDKRIGDSHMEVPGPDGRFGFGGACFPKDSQAFINYANSIKEKLLVLEKVVEVNNEIRNKYESVTSRETNQNINFNFKKNN
tara:strand:+ start:6196 stop:7047 length:852 start_codon:yes stop_codon:yes gene_type:complete